MKRHSQLDWESLNETTQVLTIKRTLNLSQSIFEGSSDHSESFLNDGQGSS